MKRLRDIISSEAVAQLRYILAASLVFASCGVLLVWPAAALPSLTPSPLSAAEGAWVVAALHAGQVLGAAPGGALAARVGRRRALLWCAPLLLASWLATAWARALAPLVCARALGGVAVGVAFAAGPLYVAEAASARLRGAAGALPQLALSLGQLLAYCGGAWLSLRALALLAAALPLLFAAALCCAPETPHWLLSRGRRAAAVVALAQMRGPQPDSVLTQEFDALEAFVGAHDQSAPFFQAAKNLLTDPVSRHCLFVLLALIFLQSFGGMGMFLPYTSYDVRVPSMSVENVWILLGCIQLLAACLSVQLLRSCGRRPLLVASSAAAALAHVVHVVSVRAGGRSAAGAHVSLGALCCAAGAHGLGLGPLPLALVAELAPPRARAAYTAVAAGTTGFMWYAASWVHKVLWERGDAYVSYYLSTACCGLAAWLASAQLPETKHLTLEQVQAALQRKARGSAVFDWPPPKHPAPAPSDPSPAAPAPAPAPSTPGAGDPEAGKLTVWHFRLGNLHVYLQRPVQPAGERAEMQTVASERTQEDLAPSA